MHNRLPPSAPQVGVQMGSTVHPAVPIKLDGHAAAVVMSKAPPADAPLRLRLDWEDGQVTELCATLSHIEGSPRVRVAHMVIDRVLGDWRPFLSYLASTA